MNEINRILSDESVDLLDAQIMRTLLNYIKVIDKHNVEFQFNCNLNIIENIGASTNLAGSLFRLWYMKHFVA